MSDIDFFNSGTYTFFFWRFGYLRILPQGLNWVARVRLEYLPPAIEPFFVMSQILAI